MTTNMIIPVPQSIEVHRPHLREFVIGMIAKLDMNSHKSTPTKESVEQIIGLLLAEVEEFREQLEKDKYDTNSLIELMDTANFAFLAYIALRNDGVTALKGEEEGGL